MSAVRLPSYPRGAPVAYTWQGRAYTATLLDELDRSNEREPERRAFRIDGGPVGVAWLEDLSLDLSSDLGRSIARGWLAQAVDADPSNGVIWERQQDDEGRWEWVLSTRTYGGREVVFAAHYGLVRGVCYPVDIGALTDSTAALVAACSALKEP